jgi:hypothetical protein
MMYNNLEEMSAMTKKQFEDYVDDGSYCPADLIDLWVQNKELKKQLIHAEIRKEESFRQEDRLIQENKELRRKKFGDYSDGEYWIYEEGINNHLESLVCPVMIDASLLNYYITSSALIVKR